VRSLADLTSTDDPAWPTIQEWVADSPRGVDVLPPDGTDRGRCLLRLQVTTRSPLGALAWETGGMILDHGWLRLLGGGTPTLPDIASASPIADGPPPFLVVAQDVLGGVFAVNGDGLPTEPGEVGYFAPDTLAWLGLGAGHGDFVRWALTGDTESFFASLRWPGWEDEVRAARPDQAIAMYPFLFTAEGSSDVASTSRRLVPWTELAGFHQDALRQLDGGRTVDDR
jgi:hypothetical protein